MNIATEEAKPEKGGMVVLKFPAPVYARLKAFADRAEEEEGREVTVTEVVRRQVLEFARNVA